MKGLFNEILYSHVLDSASSLMWNQISWSQVGNANQLALQIKIYFMTCLSSKGSDQSAYKFSLISVYTDESLYLSQV